MSGLDILFDNPALGIIFGEETQPVTPLTLPTEPTADIAPTPTTTDVKAETMIVLSMNVMNTPNLPRPAVVQCGRDVSGRFHIGGCQELGDNGRDRSDVLNGLGSKYSMTHHGPVWVQEQIAWVTDRYTSGDGDWVQAIPSGQPYPNPPRGWTWQNFTTKGGIDFTFVDTHFVNKAWNDVPDAHKHKRQENWNKHYQLLTAWLKPRVKAKPIIVVGDFNRSVVAPFTPAFKLLGQGSSEHNTNIDKLFIGLPQGWRIKAGQSFSIKTPSDHNAVGSEFTLDRSRAS